MNQHMVRLIKENKCVRVLAYPFEQVRRRMRVLKYHFSEDANYMNRLKGIHSGERCFVIGNGPSLKPEDLDILLSKGEICFGSNRIYQIFSMTKWRPTYYISMDIYGLDASIESIRASGDYPKFINYTAKKYGREPGDNIHYLCEFENFKLDPYELKPRSLSAELSWYGTKNATVTVNAIELAMYMGFQTIYLLGVDNNYQYKRRADGSVFIDPTVKATYFSGAREEPNQSVSVQSVDYMNASYKLCQEYANKRGVHIYNATRGGKLEVFERVNFEEIFAGGGNSL